MTKIRKIIGIIPSRHASTRFPGKPLVDIKGVSMIMRVYEKVVLSACDEVIVATDDQRIFEHVQLLGGKVMMTDQNHVSGTDRCAELAIAFSPNDIILNIQGDEPFLNPDQINELITLMIENEHIGIGTQCRRITEIDAIRDPNVVKLIKDINNKCMYFSRSTIPYVRDKPVDIWTQHVDFYQHIGLYAFKQSVLTELTNLPQGRLERAESLEQLRWIEEGYSVYASETEHHSIGIDSPQDLEKALQYYNL